MTDERPKPRRFQVHYGEDRDGAGYVVTDSTAVGTGDWRGRVMNRTDNKSEAEAWADALNAEADR